MAILRKPVRVRGLILRGLGAVALGFAAVALIATGLIAAAGAPEENAPVQVSAYTFKFPEDEQTLKELSAKILKNADVADEAGKLPDIETSAGR